LKDNVRNNKQWVDAPAPPGGAQASPLIVSTERTRRVAPPFGPDLAVKAVRGSSVDVHHEECS